MYMYIYLPFYLCLYCFISLFISYCFFFISLCILFFFSFIYLNISEFISVALKADLVGDAGEASTTHINNCASTLRCT